jgi:glycosyltransferase involved in cell wall biosynthesis
LLIVGSENEINVDGLCRFLAEDWPALKSFFPGSRLSIAGGVGKHLPSAVMCPDDITVLGFVENLADAYRVADIVVNPVRSGTGLNIKSIEALGYGKPLLTTPSGCRGIESGIGSAFFCAESPTAFVECVRRICCEAGCAPRLSEHALNFARDWNSAALASLSRVLLSHDGPALAPQAATESEQG